MKKSVLITALVAFLFSMNVNAQEQEPKQQKKEKEFEQFEIINNIVQKNNSNKKQKQ